MIGVSVTRRARALADRMPLRIKLLATVLVLAAAGLSVAAVAATTALHSYLVGRVDAQLHNAARGIEAGIEFRGAPAMSPPRVTARGRLPSPFYVRVFGPDGVPNGLPVSAPLTAQSPPRLPALAASDAVVQREQPFTVGSENGRSSWRVVAIPTADGGSVAVATSLSDVGHTVNHLILLETLIGLGVLLLMGAAGYGLIRTSLRPLVAVEDTAAAIAAGDLSRRVPTLHPRTEVGRLSAALNVMLGRIEDAFTQERESQQQARASEEKMRRFVADASHELRTPVTSIRGFAELYRLGGMADPGELSDSMQRIEDEAARMGLLVEDLLLLARLDAARPLDAVPVDVLEIAHTAVRDARATAPDRTIDLLADAAAPPVVTGDPVRLHQVARNLLGNALVHTAAGSHVTVSVSVDEPRRLAILEVADSGPGLTAEQASHVFERFYRSDAARSRDAGGSGLGLSIVAGIVAAHAGTVTVHTAPGEGATFRVELPLPVPS